MTDPHVAMENTTKDTTNYNRILEKLNHEQMLLHIPILVVFVLVMIIGIVGNIFVLYIYKYRFRRSSARNYIICLAMMDMSVCVVGIPYHVVDLTHIYTYTYVSACRILSFLIGALTTGSIFVLLVVAIDRYMKVCRPLKRQVADFGDKRAFGIAIGVAALISIPNAVLYGESSTKTGIKGLTGTGCFIDDDYEGSIFPIAFQGFNMLVCISSIVFLIGIYSLIVRKIYLANRTGEMVSSASKSVKLCSCLLSDQSDSDEEDTEDQTAACVGLLQVDPGSSSTPHQYVTPEPVGADSIAQQNNSIKDNEDGCTMTLSETNGKTKTVAFENVLNNESENVNKSVIDETQHIGVTQPKSSKDDIGRSPKHQPRRSKKSLYNVSSTALVRHHGIGASKKHDKSTRKITLMMLTITIVFVVSYVPFIVVSFMDGIDDTYWDNMSHGELLINDFFLRFYLVNNMTNAIIYSFWDRRFRNEVIFLLRRLLCCIGSRHAQTHRSTLYTHSSARR